MDYAKIKDGLARCAEINKDNCYGCPYPEEPGDRRCTDKLCEDALTYLESLTKHEAGFPATRASILDEAKAIVGGGRQEDYGGPEDSFQRIADLWSAYDGTHFTPVDVAIMMALLKIARLESNPKHHDSWVDLAGYAACGGEIADKAAGGTDGT